MHERHDHRLAPRRTWHQPIAVNALPIEAIARRHLDPWPPVVAPIGTVLRETGRCEQHCQRHNRCSGDPHWLLPAMRASRCRIQAAASMVSTARKSCAWPRARDGRPARSPGRGAGGALAHAADGRYGAGFDRRVGHLGIRHVRAFQITSEWARGEADRVDPAGLPRSRRDLWRAASPPFAQLLPRILQQESHAPIAEERRADSARRPEGRTRARLANLGRPSPSVRPDLNIRQGQPLPGRPHRGSCTIRTSPLKSRHATPKGCGASGRTSMLCRSRLLPARSRAKALPFSMRGVPAIAANSREGSRLLWFWVKLNFPLCAL